MAQDNVTVIATFKAKPGMEGTVKKAIEAVVPLTRAESGCINYDLHQSTEDPSIFMLYENWVSKKDLDEHLEMPYLQDIVARADEMLAEPIGVALYRMISQPAP